MSDPDAESRGEGKSREPCGGRAATVREGGSLRLMTGVPEFFDHQTDQTINSSIHHFLPLDQGESPSSVVVGHW
jgi:hypothetical protein